MLTGPGTGRPRPSATPAPSPARLDGRHSRTPSVRACSFVRRVAGEHRALPRDIDGACAPRPPAPCPAARPCTPRPRASSSSSSLCGGPSLCSSYTQQRAAPPRGPCARADRRGGAPPAAPQAILEKVVEYFHYKVRPKSRGGVRPKSREGWGVGVPGSLGALRARVSAARARGRAVARARRPKFSGSGRRRCVMRYFTCAGPLRTLVGNARVQDRAGGAAPPGAPSIVRSVRAADEEAALAGARSPAPRCRWRWSC